MGCSWRPYLLHREVCNIAGHDVFLLSKLIKTAQNTSYPIVYTTMMVEKMPCGGYFVYGKKPVPLHRQNEGKKRLFHIAFLIKTSCITMAE